MPSTAARRSQSAHPTLTLATILVVALSVLAGTRVPSEHTPDSWAPFAAALDSARTYAGTRFVSIPVYTSKDLVNWTFIRDIATTSTALDIPESKGPYWTQVKIANSPTPSTGDQTVFTDDDGTDYLVFSNASGRARAFVSRLAPSDSLSIGSRCQG